MSLSKNAKQWLLWLGFTLSAASVLVFIMLYNSTDKSIFMPGPLSDGHHQLVDACDACHTNAFGGGEALQKACIKCHGDVRVKPFDSHPKAKFSDPRNADLLSQINALQCVTCHSEHKSEIIGKDGLTQPVDFCVYCHRDVAKDRPSHKDMAFNTCKDSGCHNFHDNRALYTDYLIKHFGEADLLKSRFVPEREFSTLLQELPDYPLDRYPVKQLTLKDADAPQSPAVNEKINHDWQASKHAAFGVNCSACHREKDESGATAWMDKPDHQSCAGCHSNEVKRFELGKHGMRLAQGLSPMTAEQARLPMKADAAHTELECHSCHGAHEYDVKQAAVASCLSCHDDKHSLAYKSSQHYLLWQKEVEGKAEANTGVSCASCHMPRINYDVSEWLSRVIVDHNQSANLSPNSKMIRSSCQDCHGLAFSIDAMADRALISSNFKGRPSFNVKSMEMAEQERLRHEEEISLKVGENSGKNNSDTGMSGF
jgi:predicted CXXCH cytochrome family protein